MAGHNKVYGVCENKCFVEVLPKDSNSYSDEEILIGELNDGTNVYRRSITKNLATDFTYDETSNCYKLNSRLELTNIKSVKRIDCVISHYDVYKSDPLLTSLYVYSANVRYVKFQREGTDMDMLFIHIPSGSFADDDGIVTINIDYVHAF